MTTQEIQTVTKETQKIILKIICEFPTSGIEELMHLLQERGKKISQEEVLQVIHSIAPNKNWHRATNEDVQKELLEYIWTLESQILFMLPTKQKETTIAEFNQARLQNKQSKVPKDLIRHLQTLLMAEAKNLAKFRKFEKDLTLQNDLDINVQAMWLPRIILAGIPLNLVSEIQGLPTLLVSQFKEKFPLVAEKVNKTLQRICERFVEKYFSKNISSHKLKELISDYQRIYHTYKKGIETDASSQNDFKDQNKITQNMIEALQEAKEIISESHEGGFLSKLFTGRVKNKEGVIKKINQVIDSINQISELSNKTSRVSSEKVLLIQKLQTDYENIVLVKNQLENDLYNLNEKLTDLQGKNENLERDIHDKSESLEKAHEKIALLQQKVDVIPEHEAKTNLLREELNTAKELSVRLYQRLNRIKADLFKNYEKPKSNKTNGEQKQNNGSQSIHKIQQNPETGEVTMTTEVNSGI